VSTNVLPGDIRQNLLVAILLLVQDQASFGRQLVGTIKAASQIEAELKWHVESWEWRGARDFNARNVMNGVLRALNQAPDLVESEISGIDLLESGTRKKPAIHYAKHDRLEHRGIPVVERTIDENGVRETRTPFSLRSRC
jgi:hypothetical protein